MSGREPPPAGVNGSVAPIDERALTEFRARELLPSNGLASAVWAQAAALLSAGLDED
ncbi:hypothetical protein [Nocardia carnea]|uniref:hypothetical protein n=1 Tax=Nocardia carnea TaxID=37328 RepID=UPI002455686B|nr:hypothetical protein [Nocardia carnea]